MKIRISHHSKSKLLTKMTKKHFFIHLSNFSILVCLFLFSALLNAQEKIPGPFAFINAVDSEKPTFLYLNGEIYKPRGYKSGQMTYGARTWAGKKSVKVENEELGTDTISIDILPNNSPIVIAYAVESLMEDGKEKREIKLKAIPNESNKKVFSGLFASNSGNATLVVNGQKYLLEPFKLTTTTSNSTIVFHPEKTNSEPIKIIPDTPNHRIAIVYKLKDGIKKAVPFEDVSGLSSSDEF